MLQVVLVRGIKPHVAASSRDAPVITAQSFHGVRVAPWRSGVRRRRRGTEKRIKGLRGWWMSLHRARRGARGSPGGCWEPGWCCRHARGSLMGTVARSIYLKTLSRQP